MDISIRAAAAEAQKEFDLKCKLIEEMRFHPHIYDMAIRPFKQAEEGSKLA